MPYKKISLQIHRVSYLSMLCTLYCLIVSITLAQPSDEVTRKQLFVEYEGLTILYTEPATPFTTPDGAYRLPLRAFGKLMGAQVYTFGNPPTVATITRGNKQVIITKSNKFTVRDLQSGQRNTLDYGLPIWYEYKDEIFVPSTLFQDGFSMWHDYDFAINKISLIDVEAITSEEIRTFADDLPVGIRYGFSTAILQPFSYWVEANDVLYLELKLWPGFDVPTEKVNVHMIVYRSQDRSSLVSGPFLISPRPIPVPCVREQDTFICEAGLYAVEDFDYVFAHYGLDP